jgi:DNA-binding GntR family transcriptional regulator
MGSKIQDTEVLGRLGRSSAPELVTTKLRDAITSGYLAPGERLQQEELANRLGVSRMPIREALKRLETEGLVTIHPYRGAVVAVLAVEELQEIYEIRIALETLATTLGIPKMTSEHIEHLRDIGRRMDDEADAQEWLMLNTAFHFGLYAPCGRRSLLDLIENQRHKSDRYLRMFAVKRDRTRHAQEEHWAIFEACEKREVEQAAQLLEHHLTSTVQSLSKALVQDQSKTDAEGGDE